MKIYVNSTTHNDIHNIIVGIPEHINQLENINYNDQSLIEDLQTLKQNHIIQGGIGKIATSIIYIQEQPKRLITVGLGNIKQLNYADLLKIWGNLFQYLKQEFITETELILSSFLNKYINDSIIAKTLGLQSEQSIYQFDNYRSDKRSPYQPNLYINVNQRYEDIESMIQEGKILGESINIARDFSQIPPNILTPQYFAESVEQLLKIHQFVLRLKMDKLYKMKDLDYYMQ